LYEQIIESILHEYDAAKLASRVKYYLNEAELTPSDLQSILYFHYIRMHMTTNELYDYIQLYTHRKDGIVGYELAIKLANNFSDREDILDRLRAWYKDIVKYFDNQAEYIRYLIEHGPSTLLWSILTTDIIDVSQYQLLDILEDGSILSIV